jgi:hypothetical protein
MMGHGDALLPSPKAPLPKLLSQGGRGARIFSVYFWSLYQLQRIDYTKFNSIFPLIKLSLPMSHHGTLISYK